MNEFVIMRKEDYESICNFIRINIGTTSLITSGELLSKIKFSVRNGGNKLSRNLVGENAFVIHGSDLQNITAIGDLAFAFSKLISSDFVIPDSVTSIGEYAFWYCEGLKSITIPDSVTSIGIGAFEQCNHLTTINVPWSIGEVAGAPWGATNATINYNYSGE